MTKRLLDLDDKNDDKARELTKGLIERGNLIEAGFALYVMQALKLDADTIKNSPVPLPALAELRDAFMAGAEHLYSSLMTVLDPGDVLSSADVDRLAKIDAEVEGIRAELWNKVHTAKGSA